jgi:hypothetical protein
VLDPLAQALLTPRTIEILRRAHSALTFGVHMYATPGPVERLLVVLGEVHVKPRGDSDLGKQVIGEFWLRGVEGFQRDKLLFGRLLGIVLEIPRWLLCKLSLAWIRGSTITDARALTWGSTVRLERAPKLSLGLHVASIYFIIVHLLLFAGIAEFLFGRWFDPWVSNASTWVVGLVSLHNFALVPAYIYRKRSWSYLIHPLVAIISARDRIMADGTEAMLAEAPEPTAAIVIMGLGHLPGYGDELTARGFRRLQFW